MVNIIQSKALSLTDKIFLMQEDAKYFKEDMDPKIAWAIRNIHLFPIEVNTADYEQLLRIPGIGITYAKKIIQTRKHSNITHSILKRMGVSLKRSIYFLTCNGVYDGGFFIDYPDLLYKMFSDQEKGDI